MTRIAIPDTVSTAVVWPAPGYQHDAAAAEIAEHGGTATAVELAFSAMWERWGGSYQRSRFTALARAIDEHERTKIPQLVDGAPGAWSLYRLRLGRSCRGHARHWFTLYGSPGWRSPTCVRCGAPNLRWTIEDERTYLDWLTT